MNNNLVFTATIKENEENTSLLSLLADRFPYHTKQEWQEKLAAGRILLNGDIVLPEHIVTSGDTLSYQPGHIDEPEVPTDIEIIDSTPEFLLSGKPAGTPVSRTGIIVTNTYINILRRNFSNQDIHLMHRLDRETSGIILCALSRDICRKHQQHLGQIMSGKYYLAIVRGILDAKDQMIDLPLGKDPKSDIRSKVAVVPTGKPSRSIIQTVASSAETSLVLVQLVTGRKHQIRCHLAHLGHPVIGDKIYDHNGKYYLKRLEQELNEDDFRKLGARNHTLHAWAANITLPGQKQKLYFSQCFSDDFLRHARKFPHWQTLAAEKLLRLAHP